MGIFKRKQEKIFLQKKVPKARVCLEKKARPGALAGIDNALAFSAPKGGSSVKAVA